MENKVSAEKRTFPRRLAATPTPPPFFSDFLSALLPGSSRIPAILPRARYNAQGYKSYAVFRPWRWELVHPAATFSARFASASSPLFTLSRLPLAGQFLVQPRVSRHRRLPADPGQVESSLVFLRQPPAKPCTESRDQSCAEFCANYARAYRALGVTHREVVNSTPPIHLRCSMSQKLVGSMI